MARIVNGYSIEQTDREKVFHRCTIYNRDELGQKRLVKMGMRVDDAIGLCNSLPTGNWKKKSEKEGTAKATPTTTQETTTTATPTTTQGATETPKTTTPKTTKQETEEDTSSSATSSLTHHNNLELQNKLKMDKLMALRESLKGNSETVATTTLIKNTLSSKFGINTENAQLQPGIYPLGWHIADIKRNGVPSYLKPNKKGQTVVDGQLVFLTVIKTDKNEEFLSVSYNKPDDSTKQFGGDISYILPFSKLDNPGIKFEPADIKRASITSLKDIPMEKVVIYDLETTNLMSNPNAEVVQISMYDGNLKCLLEEYCRPTHPAEYSPSAEAITGLSYEFLKDKPTFRNILRQVNSIFSNAELVVGFNSKGFDNKFLEKFYNLTSASCKPQFDVMLEYAKVYGTPKKSQYGISFDWPKLITAYIDCYGVNSHTRNLLTNAHNSMVDVQMTQELFKALLKTDGVRKGSPILLRALALYLRERKPKEDNSLSRDKCVEKLKNYHEVTNKWVDYVFTEENENNLENQIKSLKEFFKIVGFSGFDLTPVEV